MAVDTQKGDGSGVERSSRTMVYQLERITKRFGYRFALKDVSLEVYEGEFLAIFGPNGAGKTTLLNIISTLAQPTSGKIIFMGRDIAHSGADVRAKVGLLSHDTFLYESLTAQENLSFFADLYGVKPAGERISRLLERFGLKGVEDILVRYFSRGMKQRLALARALIHTPEVIILDEPFTGLDISAISILSEELEKLNKQGKTIILTTHDPTHVLKLASSIAILNRGRLVLHKPNTFADSAKDFSSLYSEVCRLKQ